MNISLIFYILPSDLALFARIFKLREWQNDIVGQNLKMPKTVKRSISKLI